MYKSDNAKPKLFREIIETAILAGLIFVVLQVTVQNYQVEGSSMLPTLNQGDCVLANKFIYSSIDTTDFADFLPTIDPHQGDLLFTFHPPRRGEIVIFEYPNDRKRHFVKRVIATPGDQITIENGIVSVNEEVIYEPYINAQSSTSNMAPLILHAEEYFVLGDNRQSSNDSRAWGPIKNEHIVGSHWLSYGSTLCDFSPIKIGNLR